MSEFSDTPTSEELTSEELLDGFMFQVSGTLANRQSNKDDAELQRKPSRWLPLYLELLDAKQQEQGLAVALGNSRQRAITAVQLYAENDGLFLQYVSQQDGTLFMQIVKDAT